ncbi:vitamin K epoxide reductase family protein, partial [uncultured Lutibacter sp.]|uniref:vitamin K epoxide reductase family protein n=1 Tax=uncultured Lutibacter sp. TaxID=437739 RepID=UPI002629BD5C
MNNQLIFLLNHFAKKNYIQLDKEEAKIQLLSHPYYPSINSITDLFNHFDIDNLALKVENDLETFSQLPDTFLGQIKDSKVEELILVTKANNGVELVFNEKKSEFKSINEFLELWTGILVVIEKPDKKIKGKSGIANYAKKGIIITSFICLGYVFIKSQPSLFQIIHFLLSVIGIYISYLIVQHELGFHSKILDKFCSGQNKKTNCDAVLSSKGATLFGLFKLSDVGLAYFVSLVVGWLMVALNGFQANSIFYLLSTLTVPFTFFSIYYQWNVVKSWCPLCLTVVSILWLQFGSLFFINSFWEQLIIIDNSYVLFMGGLLAVIALWSLIQPLLKKEQEFEKLEIEHIKFKRNFNLFKAALNLSNPVNVIIPDTNELVFGNKNANFNIVIVTNPMCGYCKESHQLVEKILSNKELDLKIIIRFNVSPESIESPGTKITLKILELYHT